MPAQRVLRYIQWILLFVDIVSTEKIWTSFIGKEMSCKGEADNIHDMYVVAVIKKIAKTSNCSRSSPQANFDSWSLIFEKNKYNHLSYYQWPQYSIDLPQGGLEVPCKLIFFPPKIRSCWIKPSHYCKRLPVAG